jgi:hypothetical protein
MFKRLALLVIVCFTAASALSACSATDNRTVSGQAAQEALNIVVDNSVKEFDKAGGSETLAVGQTEYVVIYDPAAPEGKQVVSANLTDNSPPTFEKPEAVSIHALSELVKSQKVKEAEVSLAKNVFTIQGKDFLIEIFVTNDLVYKSNIWSTASGTQDAQVIVTTYGIGEEARKLFDAATEPAAAQ